STRSSRRAGSSGAACPIRSWRTARGRSCSARWASHPRISRPPWSRHGRGRTKPAPSTRIRLRPGDAAALDVDVLACFAHEGDASPLGIADASLRRVLAAEMKARKFAGRRGDVLDRTAGDGARVRRLLVLGLGDPRVPLAESIGDASARAVRAAEKTGAKRIGIAIPSVPAAALASVVRGATEGALLGAYRFDRYLHDPSRRGNGLESIDIAAAQPGALARRAVGEGEIAARAVHLARDLVNEPPS